jgi:hypothetical protein
MRLHTDEGHNSCGSFFIPTFCFGKYLRNQNQRPKGASGHRYDAPPQGFANNATTMIHVDGDRFVSHWFDSLIFRTLPK